MMSRHSPKASFGSPNDSSEEEELLAEVENDRDDESQDLRDAAGCAPPAGWG
jgi:hypothetical protein